MGEIIFKKGKKAISKASRHHGYGEGILIELSCDFVDGDKFYEFIGEIDGLFIPQTLAESEFEWLK